LILIVDNIIQPISLCIVQGCQMVYFKTKNPNLGIFWRALEYFVAIWNTLQPFGMFHGHLVYFVVSWKIFPNFGKLQ
jgi:hypothetical protein